MIRVACVGAGYFSRFHYDSWNRIDRALPVGSCNRSIEAAQATGLPAYDDLRRMIAETKPDLLDIILPPVAHAETIRTALECGIKTLICQKPFCQTLDEAREMVALARAHDARIVVHENFRFQPWFRALKTVLDDGLIGDVQQVTFRLRPGDGQGPEAYLDRQPYFQQMEKFLIHETGVHYVDTFLYLLGGLSSVYADLRKVNPVIAGEDAGYVVFEHENGARSLLDANRNLDHAADNLRRTMGEGLIEGTSGTIELRGDGTLWHRSFHSTIEACILEPDPSENFGGDCVHHLQTHVVAGLLDDTPLENLAEDYVKVIEIEGAIYHSNETGHKIQLD